MQPNVDRLQMAFWLEDGLEDAVKEGRLKSFDITTAAFTEREFDELPTELADAEIPEGKEKGLPSVLNCMDKYNMGSSNKTKLKVQIKELQSTGRRSTVTQQMCHSDIKLGAEGGIGAMTFVRLHAANGTVRIKVVRAKYTSWPRIQVRLGPGNEVNVSETPAALKTAAVSEVMTKIKSFLCDPEAARSSMRSTLSFDAH